MTTFLNRELREGLAAARKLAARKSARLRVESDGRSWPILRCGTAGLPCQRMMRRNCAGWSISMMAGGKCCRHW